jgi:hypothetical protein
MIVNGKNEARHKLASGGRCRTSFICANMVPTCKGGAFHVSKAARRRDGVRCVDCGNVPRPSERLEGEREKIQEQLLCGRRFLSPCITCTTTSILQGRSGDHRRAGKGHKEKRR